MNTSTSTKKTYIILLAILAMLTANMYSPGMAIIQQDLHAKQHLIQMTVSYYMLGLAIGMFFYGPISEIIGRRPILIITLVIYILGTLLSAFSHNITTFIISRALQAFGAAGPLALWQALSVDLCKKEANKMIINGYIAISCVPAISPFIGSWLIVSMSWQSLFLFLGLYGLVLLIISYAIRQPNSQASISHLSSTALISSLKQYKTVMQSRSFILLVSMSAFMYSLFYVFITETPTLFHSLGYKETDIGLFYIPIAIAFLLGSSLDRVLAISSLSWSTIIFMGLGGYLIGALLQIGLQLQTIQANWIWITLPFAIMSISTGLLVPLIIAKAMGIFTDMSGACAAMIGVTQNIVAFALSSIGAILSYLNFTGLTISLLFIILFIFIFGYFVLNLNKQE